MMPQAEKVNMHLKLEKNKNKKQNNTKTKTNKYSGEKKKMIGKKLSQTLMPT